MASASYPLIGGGGGVPVYSTFSAFPPGTSVGQLAVAADTGDLYEWNGASWQLIAGPGFTPNAITALTGDGTATGPGSVPLTLATVNSNVGSFTPAAITVNAKGLVTAASNVTTGNLSDAGTDGIIVTNGLGAVLGSGTSLAQHVADTTHNGYLSSTDWNTFNGKQAAGNYITALTGDVTATGPGSVAATLATVNSNVGSFGSSTAIPSFTVNGKGLITAASTNVVIAPAGTLTGTTLASNVVTSSLTTVGTIGTGTWQGTTIAVGFGGTGTNTTFTSGSVVFAGGSGIYTQDNANLFWDDSNDRLGIGTNAPTVGIHLKGTTTTSAQFRVDNSGTTGIAAGGGALFTASGAVAASGDRLGFFNAAGVTTGTTMNSSIAIEFFAAQNWTSTAAGSSMVFSTTTNGSLTRAAALTLANNKAATFTGAVSAPSLALTTTPLPATSGGTSFSTYTTGDTIYASASNTLSKLAIGSTSQVLTVSGGIPSWQSAGNISVVTAITTYAIQSSDGLILCSSSAFTATLPTAVGVSGEMHRILKTDSSLTNIITLATTSSQTIGFYGTSVTLNTQGEDWVVVSDGANWQVLTHTMPSQFTTFTGSGSASTNTTYATFIKRIGDSAMFNFKISFSGSPGATNPFTLNLPITIDTTKLTFSTAADNISTNGSAKLSSTVYQLNISYDTTTSVRFKTMIAGITPANTQGSAFSNTSPTTVANGDYIQGQFLVPVSGWLG